MYRYRVNGPGASIGCGTLLLLLGIVLLSPIVGWLISLLTDLVGWILVAVGLIGIVLGISSMLFGSRRR
ncbi:MAG TPA: hypothetical protein VFR55_13100 [Dehalococcoidia bacterium]|nr:hypothetical protein [Dehalococcoidia bacterium]